MRTATVHGCTVVVGVSGYYASSTNLVIISQVCLCDCFEIMGVC